MKKVRSCVFLVTVFLGFSTIGVYAASPASVCQQNDAAAGKMQAKRQGFYSELGLSEGQKKLLEENRNKHKEESKALFSQSKEKMALLRQELQEEPLNTGKIYQTNNELKKLQSEVLDNRVERIMEVRKILTAEQFKKFLAKIDKRQGKSQGNWHERKTQ